MEWWGWKRRKEKRVSGRRFSSFFFSCPCFFFIVVVVVVFSLMHASPFRARFSPPFSASSAFPPPRTTRAREFLTSLAELFRDEVHCEVEKKRRRMIDRSVRVSKREEQERNQSMLSSSSSKNSRPSRSLFSTNTTLSPLFPHPYALGLPPTWHCDGVKEKKRVVKG